MLYGTGARISEVVGLDVDDVSHVVGGADSAADSAPDTAVDEAMLRLHGKGGKERVLDLSSAPVGRGPGGVIETAAYGQRPRPLAPRSTPEEQAAHIAFLAQALKDRSLWDAYGLPAQEDAA